MIWISLTTPSNASQSEVGVMQIDAGTITDHDVVTLNGEWNFYPEQFVFPSAEDDSTGDKETIILPGNWNTSLNDDPSTYGFGTYHLQVDLPDTAEQLYGLRIPDIYTASGIYVDGDLLGGTGHPATSAEDHEPRRQPYTVTFVSDKQHVDIVIHVSNYNDRRFGGITEPIEFGTDTAITNRTYLSNSTQIIVSALLVIHALYALIVYVMREERRELFYLFMLLLSITGAILSDDDRLLLSIIPLNYEWAVTFSQLSYASIAFFTLLFFRSFMGAKKKTRMYTCSLRFFGLLYLTALLLPIEYSRYLSLVIALVLIVTFVYLFQFIMRIILTQHSQAIFLLISVAAMISSITWPSIVSWTNLHIGFYPIDMIVSLIGFAGFLFKHYVDTSSQNAALALQLQKEDKQKDQFLANTSHELRNPLHSIINITQSLVNNDELQLNQQNRKSLETVITVGQHMALTLDDLLDITLLKEHKIKLQLKEVNIQAVSSSVIDMLRYLVNEENVQFDLSIPDIMPTVYADENRLIQVLFNLLHNSVKHTEKGTITVGAHVGNDFISVFVQDTGVGISEEIQQTIFTPYEQEDRTNAGDESGIGLGLSICKELVELHGGDITVQSELNQGSTFTFTLPQYKHIQLPDEVVAEPVSAQPSESIYIETLYKHADFKHTFQDIPVTPGARILVVDDQPLNVQVLYDLLSADYDVVKATNGHEALDLVKTEKWDLVISDVMMPGMSGYTLTTKIRERFSLSELPILLLTARDQTIDMYTGFLSGANDYITKPVDAFELKVRVHALITLKHSISNTLSMEAAWLQAQIQPHFILNTLNAIISLRYTDLDRMTKLVQEFSKYLQFSFIATNAGSTVPLENELELVRSYLFIEKERFGTRLQVVWEIDEGTLVRVPPISIQTIVENAVNHGILSRIQGGTITIRIKDHGEYVSIQIIDDGVGMDEEKVKTILTKQATVKSGIGLINTNKRFLRMYGEGLHIQSRLGKGTTVTLKIPQSNDKSFQ